MNSVRDFIFIDDVVEAYLMAADNCQKTTKQIINVGSGHLCSVKDAVNKVLDITGQKIHMDLDSTNKAEESCSADILKAQRLIGWEPKYSFDSGLRKTVTWFKENIRLYDNVDRRIQ